MSTDPIVNKRQVNQSLRQIKIYQAHPYIRIFYAQTFANLRLLWRKKLRIRAKLFLNIHSNPKLFCHEFK